MYKAKSITRGVKNGFRVEYNIDSAGPLNIWCCHIALYVKIEEAIYVTRLLNAIGEWNLHIRPVCKVKWIIRFPPDVARLNCPRNFLPHHDCLTVCSYPALLAFHDFVNPLYIYIYI